MILFDSRWIGDHGIGRFAKEIYDRMDMKGFYNTYKPTSPYDPLRLSFNKNISSYDLFFSPGYNAPLISKKPYILTIHDLNHIDRKENSSILKNIYYRTVLAILCQKSLAIFTVSEFSKRRIVEFFHVPRQKIFVVGNGVSAEFLPYGRKQSYDKPYIFCVSNRKGHKNEVNLINAFINSNFSKSAYLVFTGNINQQLKSLISSLDVEKKVIFTGRITDAEMASFYRGAIFSIFPSYYEGFGLPIVESFACGTPVITSNVTSMPEIAGQAALLVNPDSQQEISNAIDILSANIELRKDLSLQGLERAKFYTWDKVVSRIEEAFKLLGYDDLIKRI
ncbi:glycosyltransferase family 4 protein [Volucribacter amazonae]|uniref:Glycosyltransferase involved in cell wall biosynthesis n=1 Tax=Volucribacter amazonae TaxID=256731 RepID=A0A9X4SK79_9PAST|nr:glycosyltransferase family 1 protein [Volucribacter amazonae]MDG6894869.1 hypothetical protein [Volucribacter amazonae]